MAKSVNKVILLGNVGQDPEVKYTASGVPASKLSLATNERFKDNNGAWQDRTEWHSIVAWQRLAEIVREYVRKGSKVYVEGKLANIDLGRQAEWRKEISDGGRRPGHHFARVARRRTGGKTGDARRRV